MSYGAFTLGDRDLPRPKVIPMELGLMIMIESGYIDLD